MAEVLKLGVPAGMCAYAGLVDGELGDFLLEGDLTAGLIAAWL